MHPPLLLALLTSCITSATVLIAFPFPTTIPLFLGLLSGLLCWTCTTWLRLAVSYARGKTDSGTPLGGYSRLLIASDDEGDEAWTGPSTTGAGKRRQVPRVVLGVCTLLVVSLCCVGIRTPHRSLNISNPSFATSSSPAGTRRNATSNTSNPHHSDRSDASLRSGWDGGKVFLAANLYDVEPIWDVWHAHVLALVAFLGPQNTYLSIYESNSHDTTPSLLSAFSTRLTSLSIGHRITTAKTDTRHWPHKASAERIAYLAEARNAALEPLSSPDAARRMDVWDAWMKEGGGRVVFLNDVVFDWRAVVDLLETRLPDDAPPDGAPTNEGTNVEQDGNTPSTRAYDLACAMDFGWSGIYDTWVARDVCGTPLRPFWPYVKDPPTISRIRQEQVFEVGACWNGIVAFPAELVAWPGDASVSSTSVLGSGGLDGDGGMDGMDAAVEVVENVTEPGRIRKRGWQMVDNATDPTSRHSPPVQLPLAFRTSNLDACDHSECFLFSYDIHRLYAAQGRRRPRILMNPRVKVAYEVRWWYWHNVVLENPVVKFWLAHWSRGYPLTLVDWIWEAAGRRRDFCTWAGLSPDLPARCPALPGAVDRNWDQG